MLGRDICGCLYLTAGDVVFCVRPCDGEGRDDAWWFSEGWRGNSTFKLGQPRELEPVTGEPAREIFKSWGSLVCDGYRAREIANALKCVGPRE